MLLKSTRLVNTLIGRGRVYVIRRSYIPEGVVLIKKKRMDSPLAKGYVRRIGFIKKTEEGYFVRLKCSGEYVMLDKFLPLSGFTSVNEWVNHVELLSRNVFEKGYLYEIKLLEVYKQ